MPELQTETTQIVAESREALQSVRQALIELYGAIGADQLAPQDVSRRFGINRNLTWKLSRVIAASDPFAALNHLPGAQGIGLLIDAFRENGAGEETIANVEAAMRRFNEVVDVHAGDRDRFELTLESMGLFERERRMEGGRELAFRGNSMIWGVRARTRLASFFLAPSDADDGTLVNVHIAGLMGFQRLRPGARWRLFRLQAHDDTGRPLDAMRRPEELEPKGPEDPPLVIREFCSARMPALDIVERPAGREYILPGGPVGNLGEFDCMFGNIVRGIPARRALPDNEWIGGASTITLPVEHLIFDLIVHRDVRLDGGPEVLVHGFPHGGIDTPEDQSAAHALPCLDRPVELAGRPPAVATPLVPRYSQLLARVCTRMGWTPSHFTGVRLRIDFPPMSSRVVVRWRLPDGAQR